jgi:hypothetical protein
MLDNLLQIYSQKQVRDVFLDEFGDETEYILNEISDEKYKNLFRSYLDKFLY